MLRLRRPSGLCSRTLSDPANRLLKRTDSEGSSSAVEKKSSAVPPFRSGHMSAICARLSKGKGRFTRGWKPQVSTLLCPRRVGALPAEVQRKTLRPSGANTPAAVRVPRSAGAEKTACAVRISSVALCRENEKGTAHAVPLPSVDMSAAQQQQLPQLPQPPQVLSPQVPQEPQPPLP